VGGEERTRSKKTKGRGRGDNAGATPGTILRRREARGEEGLVLHGDRGGHTRGAPCPAEEHPDQEREAREDEDRERERGWEENRDRGEEACLAVDTQI
jgi:hypothetical protein